MIAGLLLAAGGARRFGTQKLIHPLGDRPLVRHAADILASTTDSLLIVVGRDARLVQEALAGMDARFVENENWTTGLSTSLRAGISALTPDTEAVVVCLGDQPRIDGDTIRRVVNRWRDSGLPIVSARYRGVRGHPVLFHRSVFPELLDLHGDAGAKILIERQGGRVAYVDVDAPVPPDVDSPADLARFEAPDAVVPSGDSPHPRTTLNDDGEH